MRTEASPSGGAGVCWLGGRRYSPPEVSQLILEELVRNLRTLIAQQPDPFDVSRAIITVPAHFKQPQQEATTKAGVR